MPYTSGMPLAQASHGSFFRAILGEHLSNMFAQAHGMTLDRDGNVWVTATQEGIRIGNAKDGKVTAMIPFAEPNPDKQPRVVVG